MSYIKPEVRIPIHLTRNGLFLIVLETGPEVLCEKRVQIYVLILHLKRPVSICDASTAYNLLWK
jgi:hypothetical protein